MARRVFVLAAAVVGCAGCSQAGTKAGPDPLAVVLHLGTIEDSTAPYAADVQFFADRVGDLSGGSVDVAVDLKAIPYSPDSEGTMIGMVRGGAIDMAFVPTRAFDTAGITRFQPLQTPMLIDSPELAGAVATDEVAAEMLAGLEEEGLLGLGLVYEGLRVPLALNGAVTRAGDFDGLPTRVPRSELSHRIFEALGAVPDDAVSNVFATNGDPYVLAETELRFADWFPAASTITGNVALFPKFQAIVVNSDVFRGLDTRQQEALRQAAADTVVAALQSTADEAAVAGSLCERGRRVVLAPDEEVAAIRARLQPVVDELRADSGPARAIDAIEALKAATPAPEFSLPPACLPPTGDGARLPEPPAAPRP